MSTRAFHWCLLFVLACLALGAAGCSRASTPAAAATDDEIRKALEGPLKQLEAGHPDEAAAALLGKKLDPAVWQRTERTLSLRLVRGSQGAVAACEENLKALSDAIELYRADEATGYRMPEKLKDIVGLNGISAIPTCPSAGKDTYTAGYKPDFRNETFLLVCKGHNHKAAGLNADNPRWDPRFGVVAQGDGRGPWWPAPYHADISSIERNGDKATVVVSEGKGAAVTLNLEKVDGRWVVDEKSVADDGHSALGMMLATYVTAAGTPAPTAASDRQACVRRMDRLATALEGYSSDHAGRYPARLEDLVPKYLIELPASAAGDGDGTPRYQASSDGSSFELSCAGPHPDVHLTNRTSGLQGPRQVSRTP